jgi:microcystin degradation protein MlrC
VSPDRDRRLWHETNTFVPGATTLDDFRAYVLAGDADVRETFAGTTTEIGGRACRLRGVRRRPRAAAYAGAVPGPRVSADAWERSREPAAARPRRRS